MDAVVITFSGTTTHDGQEIRIWVKPCFSGYEVFTSVGGSNGWGVGVVFPTLKAARNIALAILDNA